MQFYWAYILSSNSYSWLVMSARIKKPNTFVAVQYALLKYSYIYIYMYIWSGLFTNPYKEDLFHQL